MNNREQVDDVRIHWTCPRCSREYWVPTTEGLTVCPKCQEFFERMDAIEPTATPRLSVYGWLFIVLTGGFALLLLGFPSTYEQSVADFIKMGAPPDEARNLAFEGGLVFGMILLGCYVSSLIFLAFAKHFLSQPKANRD